jgi:5-(carboxyamino)imidazole ribonucleotide synthase
MKRLQDCPSAPLGQLYGDKEASQASLDAFIASADVFTYEFENIPVAWVEYIAAKNLFIRVLNH